MDKPPPPSAESSNLAALRESAMQTSASMLRLLRKSEDELRQAKVALEGQTQALASTASMLIATLEASVDGIVVVDLLGRVVIHNQNFARMWQVPAALLARGHDAELLAHMAHQMPDEAEFLRLARVAGVHPREQARQAFDLPDGRCLERIETTQIINGECVGFVICWRDLTERRQAEDARLNAQRLEVENRQIQEANRVKSQFLANMSHELRTPLNAVIGFADLLHSGFVKPESPKHQQFLGHIGTSGRHLLQLINDVLDLSKVESGKFDFFPEAVDLPTVLKEVQEILHTAIQRKNIGLVTQIDPAVSGLRLDPLRLKQVLYNYLSNAIKFTAERGTVTVRAFAQGPDHFCLEVEDTGIGIAPADLLRLFTEFQQLDAGYSKQHLGTGLGLALTRRQVQAQGGSVGVRSTPGAGSVFYLVLNRVHGTDAVRADSPIDPITAPDRVLVIEDDPHHQERLVAAIAQAGFEVDAAADSGEALRKARETRYAALTLDLNLPSQRGLDLLASIRSHGASQATPVIGVTVPAEEQSATFAIANLLCKPIRSDEILLAMAPFRLAQRNRANVLVIDDDPHALDLMRATLLSIGIDAVCMQDGRDALRSIDQLRPDAIILDLVMPAFDGFQVLDALQRLPAWRQVPVYIWTSLLLTDEEYALLAWSARAILVKGGGEMAYLLEGLRRWRQPAAAVLAGSPQ